MDKNTFGKRLKALRHAAGLTQGELGFKAGFTWNGIAQLESGRRQPALATALALKRALGIDLTAFDPDVPLTVKPLTVKFAKTGKSKVVSPDKKTKPPSQAFKDTMSKDTIRRINQSDPLVMAARLDAERKAQRKLKPKGKR